MNRRERRAAAARGETSPQPLPGHVSENARSAPEAPGTPVGKPSLLLRLVAGALLSKWVLARVKNPEIERLLISVAMESGRTDAADELTRRQARRTR